MHANGTDRSPIHGNSIPAFRSSEEVTFLQVVLVPVLDAFHFHYLTKKQTTSQRRIRHDTGR